MLVQHDLRLSDDLLGRNPTPNIEAPTSDMTRAFAVLPRASRHHDVRIS